MLGFLEIVTCWQTMKEIRQHINIQLIISFALGVADDYERKIVLQAMDHHPHIRKTIDDIKKSIYQMAAVRGINPPDSLYK